MTERPLNVVGAINWRLKEQRLRFTGVICKNCEAKIFPPRDVCSSCGIIFNKKPLITEKEDSTEVVIYETKNIVES